MDCLVAVAVGGFSVLVLAVLRFMLETSETGT